MHDVERRAAAAYRKKFRTEPGLVASGPGRVNLIGEHTDYNDGFVLPCAIDRRVAVAIGEGAGRLYSDDFGQTQPLDGCRADGWSAYPRGVAWALSDAGMSLPRFQAAFAGDVPVGSGLSSSAAIETATALGLDAFFRFGISRLRLAQLCQRAENIFVGVKSGIMDQYAALMCQEGSALLLDYRTLESRLVPLELAAAGLAFAVCDTRVERRLASTGYNQRRATTEQAARSLRLQSLRDAQIEDLARLSGEEQQRARHVVTENVRVLAGAEALEKSDFAEFGRLMYASHASLRDDFQVSTPELDAFVECARACTALGARLTGAGFGGCGIALIERARISALEEETRRAFAEAEFKDPVFYTFWPGAGARVVDTSQ